MLLFKETSKQSRLGLVQTTTDRQT